MPGKVIHSIRRQLQYNLFLGRSPNVCSNTFHTLSTSTIGSNLSHSALNAVARISPLSSSKSMLNKYPSPLEFDHRLMSDLLVTLALIVHLFWYGVSDAIGNVGCPAKLPCATIITIKWWMKFKKLDTWGVWSQRIWNFDMQ